MDDQQQNSQQDSNQIMNKDPREFDFQLTGTEAATAANYKEIKNILSACELVGKVGISFNIAGSDAGAVTLQLEKLITTQAPGAGVTLMKAALNLKATARIVYFGDLTDTKINRMFKKGDRIALVLAGTPTAIDSLVVTYKLKPIGKGHYGI